jgi:hypothetical protein
MRAAAIEVGADIDPCDLPGDVVTTIGEILKTLVRFGQTRNPWTRTGREMMLTEWPSSAPLSIMYTGTSLPALGSK